MNSILTEELKKLVKRQSKVIGTLRTMVRYYSGVNVSDEKDYLPEFMPVELKVQKRAIKLNKKARELLAKIEEAENGN